MKLENDSKNLDSLDSHEDNIIIFMNDIVEEVKLKVSNCPKQVTFNELQIRVHLRDLAFNDKLQKSLETSLVIKFENFRLGEDRKVTNIEDLIN